MNIITSILIGFILLVSGFGAVQYMSKQSLITDNHNKKMSIQAYEALLKVEPFEAVSKEQKGAADEKTSHILNDDSAIDDGIYRM